MEPATQNDNGTTRSKRAPLLIENVYEKETTESFVERHFRDRGLHRCKATDEFDMDSISDRFGGDLVRSTQELEPNPEGNGQRPYWTVMVFKRSPHVLWHFTIKSNNYAAKDTGKEYTLVVNSDSASKAAEDALMLQKHFTISDEGPGFFLVRDVKKPRRIPLKPEYLLSEPMLDLHYGSGFGEWAGRFAAGLAQNGLSILRGKPGTGKTSFLRHLIFTLAETHRFYYLPVDAFGLLQAEISDFLTREQKRFKNLILVLVLEDAEQLLLDRRGYRDGLASSLLNFTDGFVGDMIQAHLICTINSEIKELDEAVLRPGRQRFFREFDLLPWDQAYALAEKMETLLDQKRPYSLAEIYHFKDVQREDRLRKAEPRPIGFAAP